MRLELLTPDGDLVIADTYNQLFTMHGVIMVWFFLIPSIPAMLGNFLVPLMIGAATWRSRGSTAELVPLHIGGADHAVLDRARRRRHRLDVLHAVQHDLLEHARDR